MRGNFVYNRLGQRIVSERKKRYLSQEQLSLLSGVDRTYLARIEQGRANPTFKVVRKIALGFRMKMSDMVKGL